MAVGPAVPVSPAAIRPLHHLRLVFWLRWMMTVRGFSRSRSMILGVVLLLLFFAPFAVGMGLLVGVAMVLPRFEPVAEQILRGVLLAIYLTWLFSPLLGFQLNDALDITRLFPYPVSVRRLFVGSILGALLDSTTLLLLPTLLAVIVGAAWHGAGAGLIALLTVPLFLFHTLALSQAAVLATAGILRSRKWRDLAIVAVPLFWLGYQVLSRTLLPRVFKNVDWRGFLNSAGWEAINLLPPGCAARAVMAAEAGHWGASLGFLLLLGAYTAATVYLASWLIGKAYEGDDVSLFKGRQAPTPGPSPAPRERGAYNVGVDRTTLASPDLSGTPLPRSGGGAGGGGLHRLPPVIAALVEKEVRYFQRDPFFRVALVNAAYLLAVGLFMNFGSGRRGAETPNAIFGAYPLWFSTSLLLFQQTTLVYNQFGHDGAAATVLLGTPASRRQILLGKNLPLFVLMTAENVVLGTLLCVVTRHLKMLPLILLWLMLALGVMFAVGNLMSVYFPFRVVVKGFRTQQVQASQGAAYTFLNLGVSLAALLLFAPALAAVVAPWYWISRAWLALTLPLAVGYAVGLYLLSLKLAEEALLRREPEILERVYRAPDA